MVQQSLTIFFTTLSALFAQRHFLHFILTDMQPMFETHG